MSEVPAAWEVMVERLVEMDEKAVRSEFAESPANKFGHVTIKN